MVQTYSNNNNIYSVDMMFAYINLYKPDYTIINMNLLYNSLEYKGWGDPKKKISYSALDVLNNPKKKKYKKEIDRINNADLRYPIIINKHNNNYIIVDGIHRLTKSYLDNKKTIKAYIFPKDIMKKFLINKTGNWTKVNKIQIYDFITLFYTRFK